MSYMFSYVFMVDFSSMSRFSCCNFSSTDSDTCHFRAVELTEATQVTGDGTSCHLWTFERQAAMCACHKIILNSANVVIQSI